MSFVANLPPLNEKKGSVAAPSRAGVWSSDDVNLDALADSFDIPDQDIRSQDLKSIPDVWAQFQVFNSALVNLNHPMHSEARAQWRALLALFALADEYGDVYELELRPLQIPAVLDERTDLFLWVLRYLLPATSIDPRSVDWSTPVLLVVREKRGGTGRYTRVGDDHLLGLLNPVTLVAPGKCAASAKLGAVPWLVNGLSDPVAGGGLKSRDYQIIGEYCAALHNTLKNGPRPVSQQSQVLLAGVVRELDEFAGDCFDILEKSKSQHHLSDTNLAAPEGLPEFYLPLLKIRVVDQKSYDDTASAGDSLLVMRGDLTSGAGATAAGPSFKGIILVDPALAETLKQDPRDIRIWKHRTLSDVMSPSVFDIVVREASEAGYLVVKPEDFFTDELVHLEDGSDIRGHAGSGFESTVLPLSPLALLLEPPDQLAQFVKMTTSGGREHKVTLAIALLGRAARHSLSRAYRAEASAPQHFVADVVRPLGFAVWPDFYHASWRWNFLRFTHNPSTTDLLMRFGISGPQLSRDIASVQSPVERARKMAEWLDSKRCVVEDAMFAARVTPEAPDQPYPPLQRLRFANTPSSVGEVQISTFGYEALCLARRADKTEAPRPVGIVLLPRRTPDFTGGQRTVAVDFGTTNTVACFDGEKAVVFKDRIVLPIASSNADKDKQDRDVIKWAFVEHMPLLDHETPMPTVAKLRRMDDGGDPALKRIIDREDDRPLFADCVFFVPQEQGRTLSTSGKRLVELKEQLKFGLKWSPDPLTRKVARRFLRQMIMMISAEIMDPPRISERSPAGSDPSSARWRFSYPEAMSQKTKTALDGAIRQSWTEVFHLPDGTRNTLAEADIAVEDMVTEGGAAANYFLFRAGENGLNAGPLSIILDIGGGTTEIAIWSSEKLCWRGSFRLAGGDFVTHYLVNNPEFFEMIGLPDLTATRREMSTSNNSLVSRHGAVANPVKDFAELFFNDRRFPKQFDQNYRNIAETPTGAGLRHCATVALGGIVFYLAGVVKKLAADGDIPANQFRTVTFAFGGRGSQFFRQMAGRNMAPDSPLHDVLCVFLDALELDTDKSSVRVLFSSEPKLEVVLGMVGDQKVLKQVQTEPKSHWHPLGETLELARDGAAKQTDAATPVEEALDTSLTSVPKLVELKRFLALLAKRTGIRIGLNEGAGISAADFVAEYVFSQFGDALKDVGEDGNDDPDPNTQLIEPPFIMALRALIDRLGQNESLRSQFLKVSERH
jgi:hypothetical protein